MNHIFNGGCTTEQRQERLLTTLEQLLALEVTEVDTTLNSVAQLVTEALHADKVNVFLHDLATHTLIVRGRSDTPMGRREKALGLDRLPLVNLGRVVEVFLTGTSYMTGRADQDTHELVGVTSVEGLGVISEIMATFEVNAERRGVLVATSTQPDFFCEQDLHFLEAVAHWLEIGMHRAELVEQMEKEARKHSRSLAAEELLTIMAHDLRNYLTPLEMHLDLIQMHAHRGQQDIYDISVVKSTFRHLDRLIGNLLDVARLDQGLFSINQQPIDLVNLVQETVLAFSTPETRIEVRTPQELEIFADPDRLHQAVENLLANAVTHAPKKTPIVVTIGVESRTDGLWAILTVSNQGPGIPRNLLAHLFQPFVAGSNSTGLGLGLYLANRIAAAHRGTLTLDSSLEDEVRFTLSLPVNRTSETRNTEPLPCP